MSRVFLGGTCNESTWREKIIPLLEIDFYNPVVSDWTEECKQEELHQRSICDYCLYVITPLMEGVYSIAEVVDDSNKRPEKTIFCFTITDYIPAINECGLIEKKFTDKQINSLREVGKMVQRNGGMFFETIEEAVNYLNKGGF